ncbi:MAG TPA: ATP-binding protein [Pyrinomonadaceae bacterium]|nr:ATP-binding protein [Pyrinomonadaceae bacterium]
MSKRNALLITAGVVFVIIGLLLPSFAARAVVAGLLAVIAFVFMFRNLRSTESANPDSTHQTDDASSEIFAFGKLFEATMGGMREGLLIVDRDMRVVASNTASHRLFNPARGPLNGQRLTELTRNPAIYDAFLDALNGTERSGVKIQTHGPERLVFDLRVVPLGSESGGSTNSRTGALGVFIDITRIDRLEQVRQEFLSNVSHELRTPLTAILAFVETLESGAMEDDDARNRFLPIIRKSASRMKDLIDDILELSAIEAGNVPVRKEPVRLYATVNDVVSSLIAQASAANVNVLNTVSPNVMVHADRRRLEQMLTNLVENAIKFNRPHGTVTIRHEAVSGTDSISVEDTGEGIPAQHLERLFERFYRADRARSREMGGTGLGLAIVKHLALAHDGEVTVTSELGKGSSFTIELPGIKAGID